MRQLHHIYFCIKENMNFKMDFWGFLAVSFLVYSSRLLFFDNFFSFGNDLGGWNRAQIHFLFTLALLTYLLTGSFAASIHAFFQNVHEGTIETFLCHPLPITQTLFFRWWDFGQFLAFLIVGVFIVAAGWEEIIAWLSFSKLSGFVLLFFLSITLNIAFILLLESFSFAAHRRLPIDFIFSELSRLTQIPPTLFGEGGALLFALMLPVIVSSGVLVHFACYGPSRWTLFFTFGTFVSIFAAFHTFRALRQKFDGHGG